MSIDKCYRRPQVRSHDSITAATYTLTGGSQ